MIPEMSGLAYCTKKVGIGPFTMTCGRPLKLVISPSPIADCEWHVIQRCTEHLIEARRVLDESKELA